MSIFSAKCFLFGCTLLSKARCSGAQEIIDMEILLILVYYIIQAFHEMQFLGSQH